MKQFGTLTVEHVARARNMPINPCLEISCTLTGVDGTFEVNGTVKFYVRPNPDRSSPLYVGQRLRVTFESEHP